MGANDLSVVGKAVLRKEDFRFLTGAGQYTDDVRPDNTAVNQRDRDENAVTPEEQGNNQKDIDRTAEIRRQIVDLSDISISGRNVKIITSNGKVTLRGPVASDKERELIEKIAQNVAGKENVTSQLEVAP